MKALKYLFLYAGGLLLMTTLGVILTLFYYLEDLPDYTTLKDYTPYLATQVFSSDKKLMTEFAVQNRTFVKFDNIPPLIIKAFLVGEDKNFYSHTGLDIGGTVRALFHNAVNHFKGNKQLSGGSTITQQVAKNFFLTNEKTLTRKIKEAILAYKIEKTYSKEKILELYLNEIYLGSGSYGITSASMKYFNKDLKDLNVSEIAYLAGLPKAPNTYNLKRNPLLGIARRNWVIRRMKEENVINEFDYLKAIQFPLLPPKAPMRQEFYEEYFCEFIRQKLIETYGEDKIYKKGYKVHTTLNQAYQKVAHEVLVQGLIKHDRALGWRGPVAHTSIIDWQKNLNQIPIPKGIRYWDLCVVLKVSASHVLIGNKLGKPGIILLENLKWARRLVIDTVTHMPEKGPEILSCNDVLKVGDVIIVSSLKDKKNDGSSVPLYQLEQIPDVNGGIVVIDPHTGEILAMVGGYSFCKSQFNRVTQAMRQPGSAIKPFIYLTALQMGYSSDTPVLDIPLSIDLPGNQGTWNPSNISHQTHGLVPLKFALIKSLNLATIWLAQQIGIQPIQKTFRDFGIYDRMPSEFACVLGSVETTLLKLTTAYGMIANGGQKISPYWIQVITDSQGKNVYGSVKNQSNSTFDQTIEETIGTKEDYSQKTVSNKKIVDSKVINSLTEILYETVESGTAIKAKVPGQFIAGKTGTSNNYNDAWFIGFTPNLVVGVMIGFDSPKSLGKHMTGSAVAAPIFAEFMKTILAGKDPITFNFNNKSVDSSEESEKNN